MKIPLCHCEPATAGEAISNATGRLFRHTKVLLTMTLILVATLAFWNTWSIQAQGSIELDSSATYVFGQQITFTAQLKSPVQIQQASIVVLDETQGVTHVRPVTFTDGHSEFLFDVRQNLIRPFSSVRWYYQLTLADGASVQSDPQSFRYADNRFAWQSLTAGSLHVFWAQGDAAFGQNALNAALAGSRSISNILPPNLAQPAEIYLYPAQADIASLGGQSWDAGLAFPEAGVMLAVIEPDADQSVNMERRIPHELMHVMLYRFLGAGYKNLPVWLNEGIATLAEVNPTADYDRVLREASNGNDLIPLLDLCASFPADSARAFLAYAEARSFTTYLRDTYGVPALLNLAKTYSGGVDCENGMNSALSLPLSQMDAQWREKALGQNVAVAALRNMLPYLVLLLLIVLIPILVGSNSTRPKAGQNGSGTSATSAKR